MPTPGGANRAHDSFFVVPGDRRVAALLGALCLALLLLVQSASITGSDGDSMYDTAVALVDHHSLAVPAYAGAEGRDGVHYSKYGLGLPLLAAGPYALSAAVSEVTGHRAATGEAMAATLMPVIGALCAVGLFLLGRRLGSSRKAAVVVSLGVTFCTYWTVYLKEFFSEPLIVLAVIVIAHEVLRRQWWTASLALFAAAIVRPMSLVMVVPFVLAAIMSRSRAGVVGGVMAAAAGSAVMAWHNWFRFGSVTDAGYRDEHFDNPVLDGLHGLFLHTDKSILLFMPVVVLAVPGIVWCWRRRPNGRPAVAFLAVNALVVLLMTAAWYGWHGNWAWGPRLVLPALVPLTAAVGPWLEGQRWRKVLLAVALVAGLAVNGSAYLVPVNAQLGMEREPRIGRQWSLVGRNLTHTREHLYDNPDYALGEDRFYLRLWQVDMARVAGRSGLAAAAVGSVLLLGVAAASGIGLRRALRGPGPAIADAALPGLVLGGSLSPAEAVSR